MDPPMRAGDAFLVPIVEVAVHVWGDAKSFSGYGDKRPEMFLVLRDETVRGFDLCGRVFTAEEIEGRYPGAVARARVQLAKADG